MRKIDAVRRKLASSDPLQREEGLENLQSLGAIIPFVVVKTLASDPSDAVRNAFLKTLEVFGKEIAQPCALRALDDPDEIVRITAANVLAIFPPDQSVLHRIERYLDDADPIFRRSIAEIYGASRNPDYIPMLETKLASERSLQTKIGLLSALYILGQKERIKELCHILFATDYHDRCAAANVLGDIFAGTHNKQVFQALTSALCEEPTTAARSSFNNALDRIKCKKNEMKTGMRTGRRTFGVGGTGGVRVK